MKKKSYIGEGKIKQKNVKIFLELLFKEDNKKSSYINWLMKRSHVMKTGVSVTTKQKINLTCSQIRKVIFVSFLKRTSLLIAILLAKTEMVEDVLLCASSSYLYVTLCSLSPTTRILSWKKTKFHFSYVTGRHLAEVAVIWRHQVFYSQVVSNFS